MRLARTVAAVLALGFATLGAAPAPRVASPSAASRVGARAAVSMSLSGRWLLDTARSEMGKRLPRRREDVMDEQGAWLHVISTSIRASGDTMRLDYRYRTDGDAVNRVLGQEVRTKGRRMGSTLRFESESQLTLFKLSVGERWTLSPDGGTLTQERTSRSPIGDEKQKLVFRRAGVPPGR